jgi:uncharacterized membrane protein
LSTQLVSTTPRPRLAPALKRELPARYWWSFLWRGLALTAVIALLVAGPKVFTDPSWLVGSYRPHWPTLAPLLTAGAIIQIHVATVIAAAVVGLMLMTRLKGTTFHRLGGYAYMAAMFLTGVVTLFIPRPPIGPHLGPFGPLHIFSLTALIGVPAALYYARQGKWMIHGRIMGGLFVGGIGIAGIGAFTPGRIMYQVFFG